MDVKVNIVVCTKKVNPCSGRDAKKKDLVSRLLTKYGALVNRASPKQ